MTIYKFIYYALVARRDKTRDGSLFGTNVPALLAPPLMCAAAVCSAIEPYCFFLRHRLELTIRCIYIDMYI